MATTHPAYDFITGDTWEIEGDLHYADGGAFNVAAGVQISWDLYDANGTSIIHLSDTDGISIIDVGQAKIIVTVPASQSNVPPGTYSDVLKATDPDDFTSTQWVGTINAVSPIVDILVDLFRNRFPELSAVGDGVVRSVLMEAQLFVKANRWNAADRQTAILHLAAHAAQQAMVAGLIFDSGAGSNSETSDASDELFVKSVSFGDRSVTWERRRPISTSISTLNSLMNLKYEDTGYGQTFLMLRRRNIIGVRIV